MTPTNLTLVLVWLVVVSQDNIQNHCEKEEKMNKKRKNQFQGLIS